MTKENSELNTEIIKNKKIVLDSCILIYACDEDTKEDCMKLLKRFIENGNRIACSTLSAFEVIRNRQRRDDHKKYTDLINNIQRIPVDSVALMNASTLHFLYEESGKIQRKKGQGNVVDPRDKLTGDLIIGGTVISYENHLLLTANRNDFPEPYWKLVDEYRISTKAGSEIKICLLDPDMNRIKQILKDEIKQPEEWPSRDNLYGYRG